MTEHTNLDLQLVQKYVRYMESYEAMCMRKPDAAAEFQQLSFDLEPYDGQSTDLLESIVDLTVRASLETYNPAHEYFPRPKELRMAIALWLLDRPEYEAL